MRYPAAWFVALGAIAGGVVGGGLATWLLDPPRSAGIGAAATAAPSVAALEARIDQLEQQLATREVPSAVRVEATTLPRLPVVAVAPRSGAATVAEAALDPRRLLAEYVASFEGGGTGSDFFRMAVAAYAWPLRRDLHAIVADRLAPDPLRLQVLAMLSGGSFRGDAETIDTLLALLREGGFEAAELQALALLAQLGDRRTADLIEALAPALSPLRVRAAAWDALVALCERDAESVLLRLLEREGDPQAQEQLLRRFHGSDPLATRRALELASRFADRSPRLRGATLIGTQREPEFVALAQEWHGREPDDEVRARLAASLDQQKSIPGWHELQATGAPNAAVGNDDQHAWACASADGGREWIELDYPQPQRADRVTVHQTCVPGCIVEVAVATRAGGWQIVWSGRGGPAVAGPFVVRFDAVEDAARVRVVLDTSLQNGWNEIDAVELAGPEGATWASGARASSRYGQGSSWSEFDTSLTRFSFGDLGVSKER